MNKSSKIFVAGHRGMVGSAIVRKLLAEGYENILYCAGDLRNQKIVTDWFGENEPEFVFHAAGKVGGIRHNSSAGAEFLYDNMMMAANIIRAAYDFNTEKLIYVGSSCIYPGNIQRAIKEDDFMTGPLELTNEPYAIAKISGVKLCQSFRDQYGCDFISAMPTNSYGPGDKYDLQRSHVLPALIRKVMTAQTRRESIVSVWGTGNPRREFIYVDDMADALIFLMNSYSDREIVNIGTGEETTIRQLCSLIKYILRWQGDFEFTGELDGTFRKLLDVSKLNAMGWKYLTDIYTGVETTIKDIVTKKINRDWV